MTINGSLQVGRSALLASQTALQVAGNNMANAATPGFHRRSIHLAPQTTEYVNAQARVGRGVQILSVRREVDTGLQARFRDATGNNARSLIDQRFLTSIETLQNELTDNDLSTTLSRFFNAFSELANTPDDSAVRALVIQEGVTLSDRIVTLRKDYQDVIGEIDKDISSTVREVNDLLDRIATANAEIIKTESSAGEASSLRDFRDVLIDELSEFIEVDVLEHPSGSTDILVNSIPVLLAGVNRGLEVRSESDGDVRNLSIRVAADGTTLNVQSGRLGGLLEQRDGTVNPVINQLNTFAGQLINQVNRVHAQGQGEIGFESATGTYLIDDTTINLNSFDSGLKFPVDNGSFFVHVTHKETGIRSSYQINVDGNADSLDDLITRLNTAVPNVTASTGLGNVLQLDAVDGYEFSFSDDSSGALAALGVNTFFTGSRASDIDVNQRLIDDPQRLAADSGHLIGNGGTALAIANLQDTRYSELGDASLREYWQNSVNQLAVRTSAANNAVASTQLVSESLSAQIQAVSGVSLDEESLNLLTFQRQFQAAARFISVIDETLQTLLSIA
ncbi:MAG: flagellar hook-associated protein FlgK [Phycisphaerales bacterium]|nr:flagellar hook-associated protein FlgK [Phycisphaerales bacterium]